jgi:hypothetical protein
MKLCIVATKKHTFNLIEYRKSAQNNLIQSTYRFLPTSVAFDAAHAVQSKCVHSV